MLSTLEDQLLGMLDGICHRNCMPTLVIDPWEPQWVSTFRDTLIDEIDGNRLEGEGHIGTSSFMRRKCLRSPEGVNIFVQLDINLRARTTIIMPSDRSAARSSGVQSESFKKTLPHGRVRESSGQYLSQAQDRAIRWGHGNSRSGYIVKWSKGCRLLSRG